MPNPFVHIELNTQDLGKAKSFYSSLFDWKLEDVPKGEAGSYTSIGVGQGTGGGMMQHPMPGEPSMWLPYVEVNDIEATTAKARELGAAVIRECIPVAEIGWLSIFIDPTGAALALWKQKK